MTRLPHDLPVDVREALARAERLARWSLFWLASIIAVVGLAMGSSQAMRTAWVEDILSLLPPVSFLIARRFENKGATPKYPYGFDRVHSLAFFASAAALAAFGAVLLYDAAATLIRQEHPTIGSIRLFGSEVWLGWFMLPALLYSIVPPVILGRLKKPVAETLHDEVLFTDAKMNKADWQTGAAGMVGILGVAFGFWWADSAAAGFIAFSILHDGLRAFGIAVAELIDGAPRAVGKLEIDPTAERIAAKLHEHYGEGVNVQMRETGRYIRVVVEPKDAPRLPNVMARRLAGEEEAWRLVDVATPERLRGVRPKDGGGGA